MKPLGKWVATTTTLGKQAKTEAGIIYTERANSKYIWSTVVDVSNQLTEDIKVGDKVLWDASQLKDKYEEKHLVNQDWILAVER